MENQEKPQIKWVERKSWDEFRSTGLFMFINTILHVFGWALVVSVDYYEDSKTETGPVKECYPARVKFRGFAEADQDEMHKRIGQYLEENASELKADTEL